MPPIFSLAGNESSVGRCPDRQQLGAVLSCWLRVFDPFFVVMLCIMVGVTKNNRKGDIMPAAINITLSELQTLINYIKLPSETRLTLTFEDENSGIEILRRKKAFDAMQKLKNSGNGNLINALLIEREEDKLK